jgi:D-alanyl-D-alanine carboxypeptidase
LARYLFATSAIVAAFLGLTVVAPGTAQAGDRRAAMVIDANTGHVLHAAAADAPRYPASLTKMMTLYLAFEAIERGRLSYAVKINVSPEAASAPPSKLGLAPGAEISLIDAIKALITKSANDIAIAIAEHIAGSEANFAQRMTETARRLGMNQTTFKNASGLPHPGQVTTARDMLTLALRLQDDFPRQYPLFATRSFRYNNHTYRNHNGLLGTFQGTDGIKTGYTRGSGFNLVSSVRRGSRHVVGAVFGGASAGARNAEMRTLLSRALLRASSVKTRRSSPVLVAQAKPALPPQQARTASRTPVGSGLAARVPRRMAALALADGDPGVEPVRVAAADLHPEAPASGLSIATVRSVSVLRDAEPHDSPAAQSPALPATAGNGQVPARGMPASTLQQQAEELADAQSAEPVGDSTPTAPPRRAALPQIGSEPAYRLRGPYAPAATSAPLGGFAIQIGAYRSAAEAHVALAAARERATDLLAGATPATAPIHKGNRRLYRARFGGFSASGAADTCVELRRRQIECFVGQPDEPTPSAVRRSRDDTAALRPSAAISQAIRPSPD